MYWGQSEKEGDLSSRQEIDKGASLKRPDSQNSKGRGGERERERETPKGGDLERERRACLWERGGSFFNLLLLLIAIFTAYEGKQRMV